MEAREMKDSGIEWIGDVPSHWAIHPMYFYFSERKNLNKKAQEQNLLSLSYGNVVRKNINTLEGLLPASFNTYNIIEAGDIVFRLTDLQNDKRSLRTGLCKERGIITSAYITIYPKLNLDVRYFHYLVHSYDTSKVFYNLGNGVRQGLNFDGLSRLMLIEPPIDEQIAIANFLDTKCSEIDSLTADIEKQIETLQEYKKSVITEAVTKGLDSNVEMKDSEVKWLGKFPKHWHLSKVKFVSKLSPPIRKVNFGEVGYAPMEYIGEGSMSILIDEISNLPANLTPFQQGDILLAKVTPCFENGNIAVAPLLPQNYGLGSSELFVFRAKSIKTGYLFYYFQSIPFKEACISSMTGTGGLKRVSSYFIKNSPILIPPTDEQDKISCFLNKKCSEIDSVIKGKEDQLETLLQYKQSLIYECVTGKKSVPM